MGRFWGATDTNPCAPLEGPGGWFHMGCIRALDLLGAEPGAGPRPGPALGRAGFGRGSGGRGAARERASVCVRSAGLLSPACADATLFLFPIFTADFSFTRASASAAPQFLLTEAFRLSILSLFSPLTLFLFLCSRD